MEAVIESQHDLSPPPVKGCEKYHDAEVHTPHKWFKNRKEEYPFWCEGVLPLDEQPPCQAYISPQQPECGEPAPVKVRIRIRIIDARIDLCMYHKRRHDNLAAVRRAEHRDQEQQVS